jgi:hypothetical protein
LLAALLDEVLVHLRRVGHAADALLEAHAGAACELLVDEGEVGVELVDGGTSDLHVDLVPDGEADAVDVVGALVGVVDAGHLGGAQGRQSHLEGDAGDQVAVTVEGGAGAGVEAGVGELLQLVVQGARREAGVQRTPDGVGRVVIEYGVLVSSLK